MMAVFTRKFLFLLLVLSTPMLLRAQQWFRYKDFPVNLVPQDITVNDAGTLFLLSADSRIFYKPVTATSWTEIQNVYGPHNSALLNAVCIGVTRQSDRIYIGTTYEGIHFTSNLGANWGSTTLTTNPITGFHEGYGCLTEIRNPNQFFAGLIAEPAVTRFTNEGNSGTISFYSSNILDAPGDIHYTANNKLLVGSSIDGIFLSNDNAATYVQTDFNSGMVLCFAEDNSGRAYALTKSNGAAQYALLFSDNYMNWNTMSLPNNSESYTTLYFDSVSNSLWLGSRSGLYQTSLSAQNWQSRAFNNVNPNVQKVLNDGHGNLHCLTQQNIAQRLQTSGNQWIDNNSGLPGNITEMCFGSQNRLFAFANGLSRIVSVCDPVAGNWNNRSPGTAEQGGIQFVVPAGQDTVYCQYAAGNLYRSVNNGNSFQVMNMPPPPIGLPAIVNLMKYGEKRALFMAHTTLDKLYASFDHTATWNEIANLQGSQIQDFSQDSEGNIFLMVNGLATNFVTHLYQTADSGATWNLVDSSGFVSNDARLYAKGAHTFLVNYNALHKIDLTQANPFVPVNLPAPTAPETESNIARFAIDNTGRYYVLSHYLYHSGNSGQSWSNLGRPATLSNEAVVTDLDFAFDNTPFVLAERTGDLTNKGIYYCRATPLSVDGKLVKTKDKLKLYPNPVSNRLSVQTTYRGGAAITNLLGQALHSFHIDREYTHIDMSSYAPGVYLIRLESGDAVKVVKLSR